jgi:hypothetical protein
VDRHGRDKPGMTISLRCQVMQTMVEAPNAIAPLEKVALEIFEPPARPSLIGL